MIAEIVAGALVTLLIPAFFWQADRGHKLKERLKAAERRREELEGEIRRAREEHEHSLRRVQEYHDGNIEGYKNEVKRLQHIIEFKTALGYLPKEAKAEARPHRLYDKRGNPAQQAATANDAQRT